MEQYSIGIDIGGTKCAVVLGRAQIAQEGFIRDRIAFDTNAHRGPGPIMDEMFAAIEAILRRNALELSGAVGIGVSCGGPLDYRRGVILSPPNLYGWDAIPIVKILEERFGVPAFLQNDANACALAEWNFGAGKGCDNVIFLTFGTGMGAGLILDGRLYNGASGMAGEVGHMRLAEDGPVGFGKAGSMEGFCSGGGIVQIAQSKVLECLQMGEHPSFCQSLDAMRQISAKSVAQAAMAGDALALEIYRISGQHLGRGLAILLDLINPDIVVIGSIYQRSEALLWPHVKPVLEREALSHTLACCRIVPAQLGDEIGDYAALSVALQKKESI